MTTLRRVRSVDELRGLVMIVMALDHVRDFFSPTMFAPEDPAATTPAWFFTRWITHFCAPLFVFLAGTSVWLYRSNRQLQRSHVSSFLVVRGIWLIFVEVAILNLLMHMGAYPFLFLQVIWVIGWSMIILAGLIYLPQWVIVVISVAIIGGHNLLDPVDGASTRSSSLWWQLLHEQGYSPTKWIGVLVAYPLIPWCAVMSLGYTFGQILEYEASRRDAICRWLGWTAILSFVALRGINIYGDPVPWAIEPRGSVYTFLSFMNVTKYPPSLLFLLMTLGPALVAIPHLERATGVTGSILRVYGRVPFFYYIAHWLVIRVVSWIWIRWQFDTTLNLVFVDPSSWPNEYTANLPRTYLIWVIVVAALYPLCLWYGNFKAAHRNQSWLSYL